MNGNKYVRGTDPETSHKAVYRLIPNLAPRTAQCVEMMNRIGRPCTRTEIRAEAMAQGYSVTVAETIRRRSKDLIDDDLVYVVSGDGIRQILWFTGIPVEPTPIHTYHEAQGGKMPTLKKKAATAPAPKKLALKKKAVPTKKLAVRAPVDDDGNGARPAKLSAAKKSAARARPDASGLNKPGWGEGIDQNEFTRNFRPKADSETVIKFLDPLPYANVLIHWLDERDRPQGRRSFPCLGDGSDTEACPLCALGDAPNGEHRFNIIVISETEPVHYSYTPSKTVYNKIKAFAQSARTKPLPRRYYLLAREGSTKTNTRYELTDYRRDEDVIDDYSDYYLPSQEEIDAIEKYTQEDFEKEVVSYEELEEIAREITGE